MSVKSTVMLFVAALAGAGALAPPEPAGRGSTPVAFFGSGLLIPYYGGVAEVLSKAGVITAGTPLAGNSGGALASVGIAMRLSADELAKMFGVLALGASAGEALAAILPDNITDLVNGRVRMGIAQLDASQVTFNNSAAWVADSYTSKVSKEDVISAMLATACLPCFLGNTSYCTFRGQPVLDGGYAVSWEQLCPGGNTNTSACIKISAMTTTTVAFGELPGPECEESSASSREDLTTELFQNGANAADWALREVEGRCPESAYAGQPPYPEPEQVEDWWPVKPDIYPGKYGPLPMLNGTEIRACQWESWTRALPKGLEAEATKAIFEQGVKDATSWLAEQAKPAAP